MQEPAENRGNLQVCLLKCVPIKSCLRERERVCESSKGTIKIPRETFGEIRLLVNFWGLLVHFWGSSRSELLDWRGLTAFSDTQQLSPSLAFLRAACLQNDSPTSFCGRAGRRIAHNPSQILILRSCTTRRLIQSDNQADHPTECNDIPQRLNVKRPVMSVLDQGNSSPCDFASLCFCRRPCRSMIVFHGLCHWFFLVLHQLEFCVHVVLLSIWYSIDGLSTFCHCFVLRFWLFWSVL